MKDTISFDDFIALRSGDLVVWRGKYLRSVTYGPADARYGRHPNRDTARGLVHVAFPRRKTGFSKCLDGSTMQFRDLTVSYNYSDMRRVIKVASRRIRKLALASEIAGLRALGIEVERQMRKELREQVATNKRLGFPPCKAWPRILKLAKQPLPEEGK